MIATIFGCVAAAAWFYLIAFRGFYWRVGDDAIAAKAPAQRSVVAVMPARDEAEVIGRAVGSLLAQDYPGPLHLIVVDDHSSDGTAVAAQDAAAQAGAAGRLTVISGEPLPPGWSGKLWAVRQGIAAAQAHAPDYLLLTDADIVHAPDTLRWLVAHAQARGLTLTSLMAKLRCDSGPERLLIPAFIFFFQMLYPFAWVNDPQRQTAAAAGGCMLVRRDALLSVGGIAAIRGELIDDCALARALKRVGPIWLGLTQRVHSIRPYPALRDVGRMITRSAYAQLDYSMLLLGGTILGMTLVYLAPVLLVLLASGMERFVGVVCWIAMALLFQPVLRFYGVSPLYGLLLPLIGGIYVWFTCMSALQHASGRGGMWKGRAQARVTRTP
jgi:hopene-associated glycosyltransferase HpnB